MNNWRDDGDVELLRLPGLAPDEYYDIIVKHGVLKIIFFTADARNHISSISMM